MAATSDETDRSPMGGSLAVDLVGRGRMPFRWVRLSTLLNGSSNRPFILSQSRSSPGDAPIGGAAPRVFIRRLNEGDVMSIVAIEPKCDMVPFSPSGNLSGRGSASGPLDRATLSNCSARPLRMLDKVRLAPSFHHLFYTTISNTRDHANTLLFS